MEKSEPVVVSRFIANLQLNRYGLSIPILGVLLLIVEGMDAFGIGFVGPNLTEKLNLTAEAMGSIYAASTFASLIGATVLTLFANRFGRRTLLLCTSGVMVPATILTALAPNFEVLFVVRFIIGMAFGATLPVAIALVADYAPSHRRSLFLMVLNGGISAGVVTAGYGAAVIIPTLGWEYVLYGSAFLSFLVFAAACKMLPESLPYLLARGRHDEALAIARKLAPRAAPAALILDPEAATLPQSFMTPLEIFKSRHLLNTVMLWAMMTLGYISINYVSYWLPTTMLHAGASVSVAGVAISTGKLGSLAFVFLAGWLADRFGLFRFIMSNLVATGSLVVAVALIGGGPAAVVLMMLAITLDASNVSGVQAVTANAFPSELRATAFGWISGLARLVGGSIGAIVGAHLISAQWSVTSTASALAWTFFASAVLVFILRWRDRASTAGQPAPAP